MQHRLESSLEGGTMHQDVVQVYTHLTSDNTLSISLSKVAGELHNSKGRTWNCQCPRFVQKAAFGLAEGERGTCQYPNQRLSNVNHFDPATWSRVSLIRGKA